MATDLTAARALANQIGEEHWQFGPDHPETKLRRKAAATILALCDENEHLRSVLESRGTLDDPASFADGDQNAKSPADRDGQQGK